MKIKVSETTNTQLDWLVAKCEGFNAEALVQLAKRVPGQNYGCFLTNYSTNWSQGGPLLERRRIELCSYSHDGVDTAFKSKADERGNYSHEEEYVVSVPEVITWTAWVKYGSYKQDGPTPLIAAMRCFCCSKMGDVVDIPEELCQQQSS